MHFFNFIILMIQFINNILICHQRSVANTWITNLANRVILPHYLARVHTYGGTIK